MVQSLEQHTGEPIPTPATPVVQKPLVHSFALLQGRPSPNVGTHLPVPVAVLQ